MAKYVLCPRCELNYMQEGEQYCDVCKAELKMGPQLMFAEDEEATGEKLCPICKRNYISEEEDMCEQCRDERKYDNEPDDVDIEKDEEWRNFLDDDEKDMPEEDGDVISFSQLADEEKSDELFKEDDEEEDDTPEYPDDEPDDFEINIDERDFEEDTEEDEDDEDDDFDDDYDDKDDI